MEELTVDQIWNIASIIWTMPIYIMEQLFPDGYFNLFEQYTPLEIKKILHDAGYPV